MMIFVRSLFITGLMLSNRIFILVLMTMIFLIWMKMIHDLSTHLSMLYEYVLLIVYVLCGYLKFIGDKDSMLLLLYS